MPIAGIYGPDDFANPARAPAAIPARSRTGPAARALPMPSLEWTPQVERETAHLYERVRSVISPVEWPLMAPTIKAINELKKTRGASVIFRSPDYDPSVSHDLTTLLFVPRFGFPRIRPRGRGKLTIKGLLTSELGLVCDAHHSTTTPPSSDAGRQSKRFFSASAAFVDELAAVRRAVPAC